MADLIADLSNATTTMQVLSNLILVTPKQVKGFKPTQDQYGKLNAQPLLFHYETEQAVDLSSDITDHFVEDNTTVSDQIGLRPEEIRTNGFIGELNNVIPVGNKALTTLKEKLTVISAYTPDLSVTATRALNTAFELYQAADSIRRSAVQSAASINQALGGDDIENTIGSSGLRFEGSQINQAQSRQAVAFQQFYGYWRNRTLFTVQTPWALFDNMAIKSLRAVQDPDSNMITDFQVTFKMIRFATALTEDKKNQYTGRLGEQATQDAGTGIQTPQKTVSLLSKLG